MTPANLVAGLASVVASVVLTAAIRRLAQHYRLIDLPNARSSHVLPIPRAGGLAIVAVVTTAALVLSAAGRLAGRETLAWVGGGLLVAGVGLLDDRRGLGVRTRLAAHTLAAVLVINAVDLSTAFPVSLSQTGHWVLLVLTVPAIIWSINLFNFMDGIDGIAAQQAVFVAGSAVLLAGGAVMTPTLELLYLLAAASLGFLFWNWAPARIFMGDAGSGYVGFALALGALGASGQTALTLWTWFILHGLFVVDATITLATRLFHHQRVFEPHRDHVYQRLTRRWQSHARVSSVFFAVNVLWLLPFAVLSVNRPGLGWLFTLGAWTPLIIGALGAGAGHSQGTPRAAPFRSS